MRVAVFGVGGVGGYFGGRLAQAGESVVFVARGENLEAIRQRGLRVDSTEGDFVVHPAEATNDLASVGMVDLVILGVKAWQVTEAALAVRPIVGSETTVLPLQNGVEAADQAASVLGKERVIGGLCRIVAFKVGPGHVKHGGLHPAITFGEWDGRRSGRLERLLLAFGKASGLTAEMSRDIKTALWEKFLFIAPLGGVGAVARAPAGIVRSAPGTRRLLEEAMREVLAVARARGAALGDDAIAKALAFVEGVPAAATSSMQRDIMEGRPSELSSLTGAVVRLAQKEGLPAPVNELIYECLLPQELIARGELTLPS